MIQGLHGPQGCVDERAFFLRCPLLAPRGHLCTHSTHAWKTRVGDPVLRASRTYRIKVAPGLALEATVIQPS